MTEQDVNRADVQVEDEAAWDEGPPDVTSDAVAEELGESFIESATAGRDPQERRDPEGPESLEPEETAISTLVDEVLAPVDELRDPD